jgi:hypothetical protein
MVQLLGGECHKHALEISSKCTTLHEPSEGLRCFGPYEPTYGSLQGGPEALPSW